MRTLRKKALASGISAAVALSAAGCGTVDQAVRDDYAEITTSANCPATTK